MARAIFECEVGHPRDEWRGVTGEGKDEQSDGEGRGRAEQKEDRIPFCAKLRGIFIFVTENILLFLLYHGNLKFCCKKHLKITKSFYNLCPSLR